VSSVSAREVARCTPPLEARDGKLTLRDRELTYLEWGSGNAETIVLVHGILAQALIWESVAQALVELGFRVVAPDLRGHGLSTHNALGDGYNLLGFASDLKALVEHLELERFVLAGHSLGSVVAVFYTACIGSGVTSLALIETLLLGALDTVDLRALLAQDLGHMATTHRHQPIPTLEAAATLLRQSNRGLSPAFASKLCARGTRREGDALIWRWDPILRTRVGLRFPGSRAQYMDLLRQISLPVRLLFGRDSHFNRGDEKAQLLTAFPNAVSRTVDGGHNLHIDSPRSVAELLSL